MRAVLYIQCRRFTVYTLLPVFGAFLCHSVKPVFDNKNTAVLRFSIYTFRRNINASPVRAYNYTDIALASVEEIRLFSYGMSPPYRCL